MVGFFFLGGGWWGEGCFCLRLQANKKCWSALFSVWLVFDVCMTCKRKTEETKQKGSFSAQCSFLLTLVGYFLCLKICGCVDANGVDFRLGVRRENSDGVFLC